MGSTDIFFVLASLKKPRRNEINTNYLFGIKELQFSAPGFG